MAWSSVPRQNCPFATLDSKLKAVTRGLQSWSDKTVGNVNSQLALAREVLHQLEIAQDKQQLSVEEAWFKKQSQETFSSACVAQTYHCLPSVQNWVAA